MKKFVRDKLVVVVVVLLLGVHAGQDTNEQLVLFAPFLTLLCRQL